MEQQTIETKRRGYYKCDRCEIDSEGTRMIPCPRGGCEAVEYGEVVEIKTIVLYPEPIPFGGWKDGSDSIGVI